MRERWEARPRTGRALGSTGASSGRPSVSARRRRAGWILVFAAATALVAPRAAGVDFVGDPGRPTLPDPSAGDPLLPGCGHADPDHLCLGLRFVAYADEQGRPAVSAAQARRTIDGVNRVWRSCGLSFRLEDFRVEDPARLGLSYAPREHRELPRIRRALGEVERLLVVITGPWQRAGTLGRTTANAWTAMPGSGPYGAILERGVGANANLIAHELGHYLNLLHLSDELSLMNPIIYGRSVGLPREQCDAARSAARQFWAKMLR